MSRILLLVMLLFSSAASAYQYCVNFPTDGNSKWSKRDNYMQVRMGVDYSIDRTAIRDGSSYFPEDFTENLSKRVRMQDNNDFKSSNYFRRWYGSSQRCFDMNRIRDVYPFILLSKYKDVLDHENGHWVYVKSAYNVKFTGYFLDVRWGKDCPKVKNTKDYTFTIYRRKHNHTNPWGCK